MRSRSRLAVLLVSMLVGSLTVLGGPARAAACAGESSGGEWGSFSRDLTNSREQVLETQIGKGNVADLQGAWSLSSLASDGSGAFQSTPTIVDGCVYAGTATGVVYALNADTGETVWQTQLPSNPIAGGIFGVTVTEGRVHIIVGNLFLPYAAALDQDTGELLWLTPLVDQHIGFVNSSAVVHDGLFFVGTGGRDVLDPLTRPPYYILDAATGEILKKVRVIPDDEAFEGLSPVGGGGVWTTAAVDTATNYLYAGTANPYSKKAEHERTNSILKIDLDRDRPTFGEIVGNYKGDFDYLPESYNSFECQNLGDAQPVAYSIFCGQQDVDFGASPNLFTDSNGKLLIGELQKSGTFHAVDPDTMEAVWKTEDLGPPVASGNSASSAYDANGIYVTTNDALYALDPDTGTVLWENATGASSYAPMSVANGVVYLLSGGGEIQAFDSADGQLLASHPMHVNGVACRGVSGGGIAIARNTIYASCDSVEAQSGALFAFKL